MGSQGYLRRVPGWPNESLADTLNRHSTENFFTICNGGEGVRRMTDESIVDNYTAVPTCGMCHVAVSDPWFSYMKPKIHPYEHDVIERMVRDIRPTSRLACCIRMTPWMNEMLVTCIYDPYNQESNEDEMKKASSDSAIGSPKNNLTFV